MINEERYKRLYTFPLVLYTIFVIYGSLIPLKVKFIPLDQAVERFLLIIHSSLRIGSRSDLAANFLLWIPLTFLAMGVVTRENRRRFGGLAAFAVFALSLGFGTTIEFVQLYFPARITSVRDILAQGAGGLVGIVGWFIFGPRLTKWIRSLGKNEAEEKQVVQILGGYPLALVFYQLLPFDLTLSPRDIYHKLRNGKITLIPFGDIGRISPVEAGMELGLMVPVGYLLWVLVQNKKYRFLWIAFVGFIVSAGIEFLQLFVLSRYSSATDIIWGTAGACVGGILADRFGPIARKPFIETLFWRKMGGIARVMLPMAWGIGLMWSRWSPFDFQWPKGSLPSAINQHLHIPFFHQYFATEFLAVTQITQEFVLFFIFGILLKSCFNLFGKKDRWGIAILMGILAIVLEGGQLFIPSRYPDVTTLGINLIGGMSGIRAYPFFVRTFVRTRKNTG